MFRAEILAEVVNGVANRLSPLLTEGGGVLKESVGAGGLDGVVVVGTGWLEDEDVVLSRGVRGGVGSPVRDEVEEDDGVSLTTLLKDGFLSCTCCFCCTASSCLRSNTHTHRHIFSTFKNIKL